MPHFIVHCDNAVLNNIEKKDLLSTIHKAALSTKLFEEKNVKVRLLAFDEFLVGGNNTSFLHVFAYLMEGRTNNQKKELSETIVKAVNLKLKQTPVVSINIMDFEKETYFNKTMI